MSGLFNLKTNAANMRRGVNPPYTIADFFKFYPQFQGLIELPVEAVEMYIGLANSYVNIKRWKNSWKLGMHLFTAHFCTLYIQSFSPVGSSAREVMASAQAKGLITSKGVGDVSVSYDFSSAVNGLDGWANWTSTSFGIQLASIGKILGKGNSWVY